MKAPAKRTAAALVGAALLLATLAFGAHAQNGPTAPSAAESKSPNAPTAWDAETLRLFAEIPVQDGGRIKPLDTYAGFKLLKLAGKRSCATPTGTIKPMPWLLDCLFFPEKARTYSCFRIQNDEALDRIGLDHESKRKRDWYSYDELKPGLESLYKLMAAFERPPERGGKAEKDRDAAETEVVLLAHDVLEFEALTHFLDFTRAELPLRASSGLQRVFPEGARGLSAVLAKAHLLVNLYQTIARSDLSEARKKQELGPIDDLAGLVVDQGRFARSLALLPPSEPVTAETTERLLLGELASAPDPERRGWDFGLCFKSDRPLDPQIKLVALLERLERTKNDSPAFQANLQELHDGIRSLAEARGEYVKIPLEVIFYKFDLFFNALWFCFIPAFILAAISWTKPDTAWLWKGSIGFTGVGASLVVFGIVLRCILRSRPPVSTLYETILFITGVAVISCLVIENLNRQRIASSVAAALGMGGMFLATKYEFKEAVTAGDTMPSLVAVLDTNFWLATHVTSVTMGYSAGLLASAIAHVWLFGQMLGINKGDTKFYKNIIRMVYGVLCFGLLFSTVGTILGGIWANYSWGRFWGWDPKENGALMIVLWELMIFHARLGGYVRDYGLAVLAILGGCVVAFSWWGVNLLGVGLHSYGFTSGILQILVGAYVVEGLFLLVSAGWRLANTAAGPPPVAEPPSPPIPSPAPPLPAA